MKKLKDLNLNVIVDKSALTINGGCDGTNTNFVIFDYQIFEFGDWDDEGCCDGH